MRLAWIASGVALGLGVPVACAASLGGPSLVTVLGWDAVDQKVFCTVEKRDATERPAALLYFALGRGKSPQPVKVPHHLKHWDAIVRRLKPMKLLTEPSIAPPGRFLRTDSVTVFGGRIGRRTVLLELYPTPVEVVTLGDSGIFLRTYEIPGRPERLIVLSFIGDPDEGGYETQVPVIVGPGADTVHVEYRPW